MEGAGPSPRHWHERKDSWISSKWQCKSMRRGRRAGDHIVRSDRHIRAASFNHTCVRIAVPAPPAPDSGNCLDNGSGEPPRPRHFSTVLSANVSHVGCVLLFRNGQVLLCWPIEPSAGPVQGSEPGLTTLKRLVGKSDSAFDLLIEQSRIEAEPEQPPR